jgi:hypothetical protein
VDVIEGEYWRIVEQPTEQIEVIIYAGYWAWRR